MAFIGEGTNGTVYQPGYILAHGEENITRETKTIPATLGTTVGTTKYVKMGTPFPSNDGDCIGLLYEDVDVTVGNMPGSVITANAQIYEDRLPVALAAAAKTALIGKGFTFITSAPTVTRPNWVNS